MPAKKSMISSSRSVNLPKRAAFATMHACMESAIRDQIVEGLRDKDCRGVAQGGQPYPVIEVATGLEAAKKFRGDPTPQVIGMSSGESKGKGKVHIPNAPVLSRSIPMKNTPTIPLHPYYRGTAQTIVGTFPVSFQ